MSARGRSVSSDGTKPAFLADIANSANVIELGQNLVGGALDAGQFVVGGVTDVAAGATEAFNDATKVTQAWFFEPCKYLDIPMRVIYPAMYGIFAIVMYSRIGQM